MPLRVLLADDSPTVRQEIKALLVREGIKVVGEAADGHESVRLVQALAPAVAILDFAMPKLNGLDAAREILGAYPQTKVILLTMSVEEHQVLTALRAKIRGYVVKTQVADELVQAIRVVAKGGTYLSPGVSRVVVDAYLANINPPSMA